MFRVAVLYIDHVKDPDVSLSPSSFFTVYWPRFSIIPTEITYTYSFLVCMAPSEVGTENSQSDQPYKIISLFYVIFSSLNI